MKENSLRANLLRRSTSGLCGVSSITRQTGIAGAPLRVDLVHQGKGHDAQCLEVDAHDVAVAVLEEVNNLLVGADALEGGGEPVLQAAVENRLVEAVDLL